MSDWQVLIPIKQLARAKSRLALPPDQRAALTLAMLRDVASAVRACRYVRTVHVVTEDTRVARTVDAERLPAWSVAGEPGLNHELRRAATCLRQSGTRDGIAVFLGDLPCLTTSVVSDLLESAPGDRQSFLPDASSSGTAVLLAPPRIPLASFFGEGSAVRHARVGTALDCTAERWAARRDVDTLEALDEAVSFGAGAHTRRWVSAQPADRLASCRPPSSEPWLDNVTKGQERDDPR
jgi:2-phospho-L-lactate guanylyltransferase